MSPAPPSQMAQEIAEIPAAAHRLLADSAAELPDLGARLRAADPRMVVTIARGSSDHAAAYLKYAIEIATGRIVASLGPSVASVYGRDLHLAGALALAISQSGESPDIIAAQAACGAGGAFTLALTNHPHSPLAQASDGALALQAGPERAVAATKSFVNSALAGVALLAHWQQDDALIAALAQMPDHLAEALQAGWSVPALTQARSAYVLGRGPGYPIAAEMALKFKECCALHAEAFSAAEVLHGPAAIAEAGFPVLVLALEDAAQDGVAQTAARLRDQGALVAITQPGLAGTQALPLPAPLHPLLDPLIAVTAFYPLIEALARARGLDPDHPRHLNKVTRTR